MSLVQPNSVNSNGAERVLRPWMRRLLFALLAASNLLGVTGAYLIAVRLAEYVGTAVVQNYLYQYVFLAHLVIGIVVLLPAILFLARHYRSARTHHNRRAVSLGKRLAVAVLVVLVTGVLLARVEGLIEIRNESIRRMIYVMHVIAPLAAGLLYWRHRQVGHAINRPLRRYHQWAAIAMVCLLAALHTQDPRQWLARHPEKGREYFEPSLARTSFGAFIDASHFTNDDYCRGCHADAHDRWAYSAHHFSSFNNPAYLASVRETRADLAARDGHAGASRFCAGCHDPAPFFSGAFDDPKYDDPNYDLANDPLAQVGVGCTTCHAITEVRSPRGNADYVIEEPLHYPFARSTSPTLQWVNRALIRANPKFHKQTFLKPVHKTAEFCGACHKVHLPQELNAYKFLRGQNHYDSYLLSGVSGHGASSFYYPPNAESNCNACHMKPIESADFGAKVFAGATKPAIHDHLFPSGNTAIPALLEMPDWVTKAHRDFNEGVMRLDLFGLREPANLEGTLRAPLSKNIAALKPGEEYLLEMVIRTLKMGHHFTQGTADSNQIWIDVTLTQDGRVIGRSGGQNAAGEVDPWSHFVNAFVIDREGRRIDRRNAEDIFVTLYNNQIPPGAGQVVHYAFTVPTTSRSPIIVDAKLQYRKFDTYYLRYFKGDKDARNDLPIMTLATDRIALPVVGGMSTPSQDRDDFPEWQRWNDYGIGLLGGPGKGASLGALRQAEQAFAEVERLGRPEGPTNRARVYLKEGRLDDAITALEAAAAFDPPPVPWTHHWLSGLTNAENGNLDEAIEDFRSVLELSTPESRRRGFDFSLDYRVWNELGKTLIERSKQERGEKRQPQREALLSEAIEALTATLTIDPENVVAHYALGQAYALRGDLSLSEKHRELHETYRIDDNARDRAIVSARRRYPAADHAAEAIVIWDLQRDGAYELDTPGPSNTNATLE